MAATIVELAALEVDAQQDGRAAIERLTALGRVILLVAPDESASASLILEELPDHSDVVIVPWAGVDPGRGEDWQPRPGGGRTVDRQAVDQLTHLRSEHGATWLIGTDETLASARACPGLLIVCVGPAADRLDPVRADHQAHSLLDAVRHIEASSTFA